MTDLLFIRTTRILAPGRSVLWLVAAIVGGVALPILIGVLTGWGSYFPSGRFLPSAGWTGNLILFVLVMGVVGVVAIMYSLLAWSLRPIGLGAIAIFVMVPGCFVGLLAHSYLRHAGFESLAERGHALADAIQAYELDHHAPPGALSDLVPTYLPALPATGMARYPQYEYRSGREWCEEDSPWGLLVDAGEIFKWDVFFYCPSQTYPTTAGGDRIERIGDWAYVHE
jgi:hypothetical protein